MLGASPVKDSLRRGALKIPRFLLRGVVSVSRSNRQATLPSAA